MKLRPSDPSPRNTRAQARRLFPKWPRGRQARWVLSRLRVDSGVWCHPIGGEHAELEVPRFLRTLPPGPPLEIVGDTRLKRLVSGRR